MFKEEKNKSTIGVKYYDNSYFMTFNPDLTATEFVEEVVAPMMIAMGYFPSSVYEALGMEEALEVCNDN